MVSSSVQVFSNQAILPNAQQRALRRQLFGMMQRLLRMHLVVLVKQWLESMSPIFQHLTVFQSVVGNFTFNEGWRSSFTR
jgi:hypothetical protein